MEKMTYKQAYDRIITAYFRNEILSFRVKFCFCGSLCPESEGHWILRDYIGMKLPYSYEEFKKMEDELFNGMGLTEQQKRASMYKGDNYEEDLFNGICRALDELRRIHIERGENVDGELTLTKRKLEAINA